MSLAIIPMCNCLLHTKVEPIAEATILTDAVQNNIQQMRDLYHSMPAVGLAAPQVNWNARVFLIGIDEEHSRESKKSYPLEVFINPEFTIIDEKKTTDWEGCFSVFNGEKQQMLGQVSRYYKIRFTALDEHGQRKQGELDKFYARVFQHEHDHLNGIRYVNRMNNGSLIYLEQGDDSFKVHMHQLPDIIAQNKQPALNELVPVLRDAPASGLSKKLLQEIVSAYESIGGAN